MFTSKNTLCFPGIFRRISAKFPGKIFANFRNFGNFPEISPEIFPDFPMFYNNKHIYFCAVPWNFHRKCPLYFREFSGNFRGKFFANFRNLGNFPEIPLGVFYEFSTFYVNKKLDFRAVSLCFQQKKTSYSPWIFGKFFRKIFHTFVYFREGTWNFPVIFLDVHPVRNP